MLRRVDSRGRGLAIVGALLAALARAPAARAADDESVVSKKMRFAERRGSLVVSASFTELFDEDSFDRLSSGFQTTVVVRVYVYKKDEELPVSFALFQYRVVYDLWDEVYIVRSDGPGGRSSERHRSPAEALRAVTALTEAPIAELDPIEVGPHYFAAMVIELNPVSKELLAEMRRWLSKPATDVQLDTSSSFFGNFVSVFVNPKLEAADRVLKLRSQPFYRTPR